MELELVRPAGSHRVHAAVLPDIGPVSSVLAQLKRVDMRSSAVLEGKHQFVPGAVEGPHAAIVLGPDDEVLEFAVDGAGFEHLAHMAPVHADVVDRSVAAEPHEVLE